MRLLALLRLCATLLPFAAIAGETPAELDYRATLRTEQLGRVLPILVNEKELSVLRRQLATALRHRQPAGLDAAARTSAQELISRPWLGDIRVVYAVDASDPAPLVSQALLDDWGIDAAKLDEQALGTLRRHFGTLPHRAVARLPWLQVIEGGDGYVASRLLLAPQWSTLAEELGGGPLVAGVPTRDIVVFTTAADRQRLEQLADTVATVAGVENHAISARLFEWRPDGWHEAVLAAPAPGAMPERR